MTKQEAIKDFNTHVLPQIREKYEQDKKPDYPARREGWNNYTDYLCKSGQITMKQYESWDNIW